jgi:hypothetical protein
MRFQAYWDVLELVLGPILLSVILVSLPMMVVFRRSKPKEFPETWAFIIVFSLLGSVVGICIGASRESVIGTVFPVFLTAMMALAGYAFTKEGLAKIRPVIPYCLVAMLLLSPYWVFMGAKLRLNYEIWHTRFEKIEVEFEKAKLFKKAGLPLPNVEASKMNTSADRDKSPDSPPLPPPAPSRTGG